LIYQGFAALFQRDRNAAGWNTRQVEGIAHLVPQYFVEVWLASIAVLSCLPKMTRQATYLVVNIAF
jgi:hypothetical protein